METPFRERLALSCFRADQARKFDSTPETENWKKSQGLDYPTSPFLRFSQVKEKYLVEAAEIIAQSQEEAESLLKDNVEVWVNHLGIELRAGEEIPWQVVFVADRVLTPEEEAYALALEREITTEH